jgi:hypothetical protein
MKVMGIDVLDGIDAKKFKSRYFYLQKPVVIKGLANNYPAGKKWTMDYIKKVCGDVPVDIYDNSKNNKASAYTQPDGKMLFSDYADTIIKNGLTTLRMFLFNMFKCRPELRKDFPCPELFRGVLGRIGFMFFGSKGIKVRIHQDMDMSNVLLTQFYGRKKVVLIPPAYSDLLYRLPFNTHSLVDLDRPDLEKYPGLFYLEKYECILEPGDALFMPSGYWHFITYLDSGFSVSYRKLAYDRETRFRGFLNVCVYMPFDKLMNRILNKKWLSIKEKMAETRANKAINKIKMLSGETKKIALSKSG